MKNTDLRNLHFKSATVNCKLQFLLAFLFLSIPYMLLSQQADSLKAKDLVQLSFEDLMNTKIISASRSYTTIADAPAKVTIITRQQIHERGYFNLYDLLCDLTSVDVHNYSHETNYNRIVFRGVVGNNRFIIQKNGISIGSPAGDPIAIADNFPLFGAHRVEIVYGPVSALYGTDAFAGVINIVTSGGEENEAIVGTHIGEDRYRYFYANADYRLSDKVRFSFAGHLHQSDNPNLTEHYGDIFTLKDLVDFDGNIAIPAENRQAYYGATKSHTLTFGLQLGQKLQIGFYQSRFQSPTTTGMLPNAVNYDRHGSWTSTVRTIHLRQDLEITKNLSVLIQPTYSYYQVDPLSKFNNLYSDYQDGYKFAQADKVQLDMQINYSLNSLNIFVAGIVVERLSTTAKTPDLLLPYDPNLTSSEQALFYSGTASTIPVKIFDSYYNNVGGYIQYRRSWHRYFDTNLGLRYDYNSRYGGTFNPRLGGIFKLNKQFTAKILYGEAFMTPAPEFTFEHFGAFSGEVNSEGLYTSNFFFVPNSNLEPEKIRTIETNLSYLFTSQFSLGLSLFHSKVDNYILNTSTPEPISDFIDGGFIANTSYNDNIGKLETNGGDIELSYMKAFNSSQIKIWGSYSYTNTSLRDTKKEVDVHRTFVPKNKVKSGITYRFKERYYLTTRYYWVDDIETEVVELAGGGVTSGKVRSYNLVSLNTGIDDILGGISLSLRIDNLLNSKYYNAGTANTITFAETPQNPRQFFISLSYRL